MAHERLRKFALEDWFGQQADWQGCMVVKTNVETFVRGQTGAALDGSRMHGLGRGIEDAAAQAEAALTNLKTLLEEAGGSLHDVCKITVCIADRAYRSAVYPVIGKHLRGVHPVSTGLIFPGFARPEILFELDAYAVPSTAGPHQRFRKYHSSMAKYGLHGQNLDCDLCMVVKAGKRVFLRGQTGVGLDEKFYGLGDAAAQADQAMKNVKELLGDAGASLKDVTKAVIYVTDRAYMMPVVATVARHFADACPPLSHVIIKGLASPELLMEVDVSAVLP